MADFVEGAEKPHIQGRHAPPGAASPDHARPWVGRGYLACTIGVITGTGGSDPENNAGWPAWCGVVRRGATTATRSEDTPCLHALSAGLAVGLALSGSPSSKDGGAPERRHVTRAEATHWNRRHPPCNKGQSFSISVQLRAVCLEVRGFWCCTETEASSGDEPRSMGPSTTPTSNETHFSRILAKQRSSRRCAVDLQCFIGIQDICIQVGQ